jgi:hypothetical protein
MRQKRHGLLRVAFERVTMAVSVDGASGVTDEAFARVLDHNACLSLESKQSDALDVLRNSTSSLLISIIFSC